MFIGLLLEFADFSSQCLHLILHANILLLDLWLIPVNIDAKVIVQELITLV